jgi:hypothetical protein
MSYAVYKLKTHRCTQCGEEKLHGAACAVKGVQGIRWICRECIERIEAAAESQALDGKGAGV